MGAVGTVLAVVVAFRIARREALAETARERAEQAQREAERAEQETEQARPITVEMLYPSAEDLYRNPCSPEQVRITNHGSKPIFYPRVEGFTHQNNGTTKWDIVDFIGEYYGPTIL